MDVEIMQLSKPLAKTANLINESKVELQQRIADIQDNQDFKFYQLWTTTGTKKLVTVDPNNLKFKNMDKKRERLIIKYQSTQITDISIIKTYTKNGPNQLTGQQIEAELITPDEYLI